MTGDSEARARIRQELDMSMIVVAGAGTGKTTALVERIVELVRGGTARLREIAAITFTEAAAAELRERVRSALLLAAANAPASEPVRLALEELDEAAISTLHSFAQRMLLEHCAAAGIPAGFEVLDDTSDTRDFELRWSRFADRLFEDTEAEPALRRGFLTGLRHTDMRAVARILHDNWDRLDELDVPDPRDTSGGGEASSESPAWPDADPAHVIEALDRALGLAHLCEDEDDLLLAHLQATVKEARDQLWSARDDEDSVLQLLHHVPLLRCGYGRQENWGGRISEVREACAEADRASASILEETRRAVLAALLPRLVAFVLGAARERADEGTLTFHDLLVHARRLLRLGGEPLDCLRRRYRRVLVDEFQDTDPIQVELAARLTAAVEGDDDLAHTRPGALFVVGDPKQSIYRFRRADIELFERVGADIAQRVLLQQNFRSVPAIVRWVNAVFTRLFSGEPTPGQVDYEPLLADRAPLEAPPTAPQPSDLQMCFDFGAPSAEAAVRPSDSTRQSKGPGVPKDSGKRGEASGPSVVLLGRGIEGSVGDVRSQCARDTASYLTRAISDAWLVADQDGGQVRRARFGDVAVLIPARSSLPSLEEAFEQRGIPYRLEGASMLWASQEVLDVLAVLRSVDDPADAVSVVAALRSPGLACGDDDLLSWHLRGGGWDPRAEPPAGLEDHPVRRAMRVIDELHRDRWWTEPSSLVARACDELRSFELAFGHRRPRDHWQRLRWLCDQARLFDETEEGTLRAFLSWAELKAEGDRSAAGTGPPDPDDDAVRVMTVHGAKGLEFPIVFLCGLERLDSDSRTTPVVLWGQEGNLEVRAGPTFRSDGYERAQKLDAEMETLERIRLLYVAATRARDHLAVCVHHRTRNGLAELSLATRVWEASQSLLDLWEPVADEDLWAPPPGSDTSEFAGMPLAGTIDGTDRGTVGDTTPSGQEAEDWTKMRDRWRAERAQLLERLRRQPVVPVTALADAHAATSSTTSSTPSSPTSSVADTVERGQGAEERDPLDGMQAPRGRGGPGTVGETRELSQRIGRAVHGVLASVDLATGRDGAGREVAEVCESRAVSQGIAGQASRVTSMVRAALASDVVRRASTRRHLRELYVAVPIELCAGDSIAAPPAPGVMEGFVDLLFEDEEGFVVVDYKTDRLAPGASVAEAARRHAMQVAGYAEALKQSTNLRVSRCVVLFIAEGSVAEHVLEGDELDSARREARVCASAALAG